MLRVRTTTPRWPGRWPPETPRAGAAAALSTSALGGGARPRLIARSTSRVLETPPVKPAANLLQPLSIVECEAQGTGRSPGLSARSPVG